MKRKERIALQETEVALKIGEGDYDSEDIILSNGKQLEIMPQATGRFPDDGWIKVCTIREFLGRIDSRYKEALK